MKTKWKLLTAIIWSVMIVLSFGALTASAAQSSLLCLVEPTEGAELKLYVYKRGEKTYLKKEDRKIGNYDVYEIEIPEIAGSGTTVYFEVKAASACYILDKLESDDIKIFKDERDIQQYKFTSSKDAGKVRHVRVLMKTNHYLTVVAKKEATCAVPGNNQYYKCSRCGKCFIDQNGTRATTEKEQQIISNKHTLTKTTKVDATCEKDGNKDYFKCTVCQKYFSDAEGKIPTTLENVTIKALGHQWDKGVVTTPPTTARTGVKTFTCLRCGKTLQNPIPKLYVDPISASVASPDQPITLAAAEKSLMKKNFKGAVKPSSFGLMCMKGKAKGAGQIKLIWNKVPTADRYLLYCQENGKKLKKAAEIKARKFTFSKLKKGKYYKFIVVAANGTNAVAVSKPVFLAPGGSKYKNSTNVTAETKKVNLSVGGTFKASAKVKWPKGSRKMYRGIRYETSNYTIATVSDSGIITGKARGDCVVRAYAQSGFYATINVKVR